MKRATITHHCDKCGSVIERKSGMIIENLSAQISGYSPGGSGGHRVRDLEFCYACSTVLHEALGLDRESVRKRNQRAALEAYRS
jgi:hypothetical protein